MAGSYNRSRRIKNLSTVTAVIASPESVATLRGCRAEDGNYEGREMK
jgi:hypothetical protein